MLYLLLACAVLLLLIIGLNVIQQQRERVEAERRAEVTRQRAIIDETESVLSNTGMFPCSSHLVQVLYQRIQEALSVAENLSKGQVKADYQRRQLDVQAQIDAMRGSAVVPTIENFRLPDNDKQILVLVQTLKKLKAILRAEHNKGKVEPGIFTLEENRIDNMQLRINVDSMLSRARAGCILKQYGSAKQMVTKALSTLHAIKAQTPGDPFIMQKVEEAKQLLDEIMAAQSVSPDTSAGKKTADDLDMLFQPKRKW